MAVNKFVPEIWAKEVFRARTRKAIIAQAGIINRDYEGEIKAQGDQVHINGLDDVTVSDYDRELGYGTPQRLSTNRRTLLIDQAKGFSLMHDDIDKVQENQDLLEKATANAGEKLALAQDDFVVNRMVTDALLANKLSLTGADGVQGPEDMYDRILVEALTLLTENEVPVDERYVLCDPRAYAQLLRDDRFVKTGAQAADGRLVNGKVGEAAGFDIVVSNSPAIKGKVVAGHSSATTVADQLVEVYGFKSHTHAADQVNGLHVYGAKVIRPESLVVVTWDKYVAPAA